MSYSSCKDDHFMLLTAHSLLASNFLYTCPYPAAWHSKVWICWFNIDAARAICLQLNTLHKQFALTDQLCMNVTCSENKMTRHWSCLGVGRVLNSQFRSLWNIQWWSSSFIAFSQTFTIATMFHSLIVWLTANEASDCSWVSLNWTPVDNKNVATF